MDTRSGRLALLGRGLIVGMEGSQAVPDLALNFPAECETIAFDGNDPPLGLEDIDRESHQPGKERPGCVISGCAFQCIANRLLDNLIYEHFRVRGFARLEDMRGDDTPQAGIDSADLVPEVKVGGMGIRIGFHDGQLLSQGGSFRLRKRGECPSGGPSASLISLLFWRCAKSRAMHANPLRVISFSTAVRQGRSEACPPAPPTGRR
jgi:hypothetical protein